MTLLTLPFVPPFGVLGVIAAYLLILAVGFWRTATDLDKHTEAGAELVVHVLAKQAHSGETGTFEVVRGLLPGLGTIVPLEVGAGSEAAGSTLGDLNLRGRTGATVVALSRDGQRKPLPTATTMLQAGDMMALTGSGNAIGLAAALLRARDTSSPPSATAASAPPGADRLRLRQLPPPHDPGEPLADAEIVGRQHVGMPQAEEQQHFDGPSADAAHHGQPLDHVLRRHPAQLRHRGDDASLGVVGQIADRLGLRFGETGTAHSRVRCRKDSRRGGERRVVRTGRGTGRRWWPRPYRRAAGTRCCGPAPRTPRRRHAAESRTADPLDDPAQRPVAQGELPAGARPSRSRWCRARARGRRRVGHQPSLTRWPATLR